MSMLLAPRRSLKSPLCLSLRLCFSCYRMVFCSFFIQPPSAFWNHAKRTRFSSFLRPLYLQAKFPTQDARMPVFPQVQGGKFSCLSQLGADEISDSQWSRRHSLSPSRLRANMTTRSERAFLRSTFLPLPFHHTCNSHESLFCLSIQKQLSTQKHFKEDEV